MPVYEVQGKRPVIAEGAFVHPEAVVIGDVTIGSGCFIGPGAVIRAELGQVVLEDGVSFQDNAVIHVNSGTRVYIARDTIIGHGAILHDVSIETGCVIGMGSILLFDVVCEKDSIVAAGSVVSRGTRVPEGCMAIGNPAVIKKRTVTPEQREQVQEGVRFYRDLADQYSKTMKRLS